MMAPPRMQKAVETGSAAEEPWERIRRRWGLFLAPVVCVTLGLMPVAGLTPEAHRLLAVMGLVVVLWATEALPLAVTALLGPALCVMLGIAPAPTVFRGFADPIILLFLGSFILSEAMLLHGLNRRIAFGILSLPWVGRHPGRLLVAFGLATGFISMWCSNTATTAMMSPIALAILTVMARRAEEHRGRPVRLIDMPFGAGLMLMTAFAASLGGVGTPVGTPTNLVGLGQIERTLGRHIGFFEWMLVGLPVAWSLIWAVGIYLRRLCPAEPGTLEGGADWIATEKARLGRLSRAEGNVLTAFALTVALWLLPGGVAVVLGEGHPWSQGLAMHLPESVAALAGAILLFILPVDFGRGQFTMTWAAAARIDWGTILLFGGGLALGDLMFSTGLARWVGEGLANWFAARTTAGLVMMFTAVAIVLSETTSNTASAAMVVPVAIAVAQSAGVDPMLPALGACLGASMGFMLPVSTPPNAIVYGSGCVPLSKMVRHGAMLDVAGFVVVVAVVLWWAPVVLG